MDHGRVIASGTTEELKKMIKTGETITVEALLLTEKQLQDIEIFPMYLMYIMKIRSSLFAAPVHSIT